MKAIIISSVHDVVESTCLIATAFSTAFVVGQLTLILLLCQPLRRHLLFNIVIQVASKRYLYRIGLYTFSIVNENILRVVL